MLITTSDGQRLVKILQEEGIKASIIGKIIKEKGVLVSSGIEKEIVPPERDELLALEEKFI